MAKERRTLAKILAEHTDAPYQQNRQEFASVDGMKYTGFGLGSGNNQALHLDDCRIWP